jgi:eukaryotic-like serine/threonine-protein kinase
MEIAAGTIVASRYQLDRCIGEGGMGVVWAATHLVTRRPVALKFLKGTSPEHTKRFLREARIAGMLGHPHIVQVHDVLELPEDGTPTMVMELLSGESLDARLERGGPIPLRELARLMLPVISAVSAAHERGVVHRDLKPDNIFLAASPHASVDVKVLDFGIAKLTATQGDAASTAGLTQTGAVMGTPYYMAPEQVFGEQHIDPRADVWALGVILYECLSGRRPIEGDNFGQIFKNIAMTDVVPIEQLVPSLPADVAALIRRMLTRERDRRPGSLGEVAAVLSLHQDGAVFDPHGALPQPPSQAPGARSPAPDTMGAAASAVTGGPTARHGGGVRYALPLAALVAIVLAGTWRYTRSGSVPASAPPVSVLAATVAVGDAPPPAPSAEGPRAPETTPPGFLATAASPSSAPSAAPTPPPLDAKPRHAAPRSSSSRPDKKVLPGGIHGDSPY